MAHPYVEQFHNPADEPESASIIHIKIDDNTKYTAEDYRDRFVHANCLASTRGAREAHARSSRATFAGSTRRLNATKRIGLLRTKSQGAPRALSRVHAPQFLHEYLLPASFHHFVSVATIARQ